MKLQTNRLGLETAPAFLGDLMETLTARSRALLGRRDRGADKAAASPLALAELAERLLSRRGEASGTVIASALVARFDDADADTRIAFLVALAEGFGPDRAAVDRAIEAYRADPSAKALARLHDTAEPRRQELFRRINLAAGGTAALVRMREVLMANMDRHPEFEAVDADFAHLFSSWFNRGFLVLRRIDWTTPAVILEKIIRYEAVHAIRDWDDLRNRLAPPDRRCYGFFHPQLVDEPLIFVEVALTRSAPAAIAPLLDLDRKPLAPFDADTAVFYSISNTQRGLAGVSFGNFLIKQVVEELKRDVPNLSNFVTLSPVPGFAAWLGRERADPASPHLDEEARAALAGLDTADWWNGGAGAEPLRAALSAAAARYFVHAKGRGGRPIDPVARFHLGNGARLDRLNLLGDLSQKGLGQSHGLMVNYRYDLAAIEPNHEAFAEKGTVAAAPDIRKLAGEARKAPAEASLPSTPKTR